MTTNKSIEFKFTVDQASVQKAKQALTDLISLADRLGKALSGAGGGARHGNAPPLSFLSGMGVTGNRGGGVGAGPGANPGAGITAAITAQARGIKDLSKISSESLRNMAGDLRKSVEDQKRALKDLDAALETAGKRFQDLKSRQSQLVSSMMAQGASPSQARAHAAAQIDAQEDYVNNLKHRRHQTRGQYEEAVKNSRDYYDKVDPYEAGRGPPRGHWERFKGGEQYMGINYKTPTGQWARPAFVGAAALGGVVAGVNEMQKSRFDFISNEARQAQAWGTVGLATKKGDMTYGMAMLDVLRDSDKAKEFKGIGAAVGEARLSGAGSAVTGILSNPNIGAEFLRKWNEADTVQKEKLREYADQAIQAKPEDMDRLATFQSEASMRVHAMRRMGMGSEDLSKTREGFAEDIGSEVSAFDAVRGGGFAVARKNMWHALSAQRGGLNSGDIGQVIAAQTPSGDINQLMKTIRVELDPVASEHLAKGIASGINSSIGGVVSGLGLGEALRFGTEGMTPEMQARTLGKRAGALGAVAGVMGGADGFGKSVNILSAMKVLGEGRDMYSYTALDKIMADPAQVAAAERGETTAFMRANDLTPEDVQKMNAEARERDTRGRVIDQGGARLSDSSKAMKTLKEGFGGNIKKMIGNMKPGAERTKMIEDLAVGEMNIHGFKTMDEAETYVSLQAGFGSGPISGKYKTTDSAGGSRELEYVRKVAADQEKNQREWVAAKDDDLKKLTALSQEMGKAFISMGELHKNADDAATSIKKMQEAADAFSLKYGTKAPINAKEVEKTAEELKAQAGNDKVVAE